VRAGYHRDATYVTFNEYAMLPDETLAGFTAGVAVTAPRITSRLGAHAAFDLLARGRLSQDAGARDGSETSSRVYYASAGVTFQVIQRLEASLGYALTLARFGFAGPSDREASAVDGRRRDRQHLVSVGARYSF
jgi:hypothetical protein